MQRHLFVLLALATACAAEQLGSAPIAGTGMMASASSADPTSSSSESSTGTSGEPGPCAAYLGCLEQCATAACMDDCAEITGVDVEVCMQIQCMAWEDACAHGDRQACERLPECAPGHESSTGSPETGSSTGTGSTDTGATESSSGSSEGGSGTSSSTG